MAIITVNTDTNTLVGIEPAQSRDQLRDESALLDSLCDDPACRWCADFYRRCMESRG
jgi:hypothetical protein